MRTRPVIFPPDLDGVALRQVCDENNALRAEIERLRKALENIVQIDEGGHKRADDYGRAYRFAREALSA